MSNTAGKALTPPEPLSYGYRELCAATGLGRRTIQRLISTGQFPKPRKVGERTLFLVEEVRAWLQKLPESES